MGQTASSPSSTQPVAPGAVENVVILGTGPAGLTAAIYAARANLKPLCVEGEQPGGQLTITTDVENYPGFATGVMGPELMTAFRAQAERFGTRFLTGNVHSVEFQKRPFKLKFSDGREVLAKTVILSTGASAKWTDVPGETRLRGKGVSACATCDGFFFRKQHIAVIGGGDTAMEEATFLTRFAESVTVIHRRDTLRASKIMQDKAFKNPKIKFLWDTAVEEVLGDQSVTGLRVKNLKTGKEDTLSVTGFFVAIGHEPNSASFRDQIRCDEAGYVIVEPGTTRTNIPGVFAAGDLADKQYRQAVTAAGTGCMAAIDAERFIEAHDASEGDHA